MSRRTRRTAPDHVRARFEGYHPDDLVPPDPRQDRDPQLHLVDGTLTYVPVPDDLPDGTRPTTWEGATHGPHPRPEWVVTDLGAVDTELGIVKTGKEADVHLLSRTTQDGRTSVLMAAKRYRSRAHRDFHRDASYLEGRRVRRSREMRAMATRTEFGRELLAGQWASAEFATLSLLWSEGLPVPYPVQLDQHEILMEFLGEEGAAAPRLANVRPDRDRLHDYWQQAHDAVLFLARSGYAHGDLSPYNILVHHDRLYLIDLPQVVDVVTNPNGADFLHRDVVNVVDWFVRRGLDLDAETVFLEVAGEARLF